MTTLASQADHRLMGHKSAGPNRWGIGRQKTKCPDQTLHCKSHYTTVRVLTPPALSVSCNTDTHPLLSGHQDPPPFIHLPRSDVSKCWRYSAAAAFTQHYCAWVFPHMVAKHCLLTKIKKKTLTHSHKWSCLMLVTLTCWFAESSSLVLFCLRLPGPQSCVCQLWGAHSVSWFAGWTKPACRKREAA